MAAAAVAQDAMQDDAEEILEEGGDGDPSLMPVMVRPAHLRPVTTEGALAVP